MQSWKKGWNAYKECCAVKLIEIYNLADTLAPVRKLDKGVVVLLAAYAAKTRLIDNAVM